MKPLRNCPYCGCNLKSLKQNEMWYEQFCPDYCIMKYHQYFDGDFTSDKLRYISFETAHFHIYVYFENGFYPNLVHFYSLKELEIKGTARPIIDNFPAERIPVEELDKMAHSHYEASMPARKWLDKIDHKLKTLTIFS